MQSTVGKLDARVPQGEIGDVYDGVAGIYNLWGRLTETTARNRALELADIQDGQNILEIAVGTGLAFYEIARRNPHGHNRGIDLSEGMLKKAEQRMQSLHQASYSLRVGTAFHIQVDDESVDTLVNNYMFDLIPFENMGRILDEFKRVLKTGGRLILVNMTEGERWGSRIYDRIYNWSPRLMGGCRGVKLADSLRQHGFHVDVREYYQQILFPSEVIRAYKPG